MESLTQFFSEVSSIQKATWILGCLLFAWFLEAVIPLAKHNYNKLRHDGINLVFLLFSVTINLLIELSTVGLYYWVNESQTGLLQLFTAPAWFKLLMAFLALDLMAQYTAHYLLHKVKWMWKLHMVHHSDTKVDATTGTRHHPGDYLVREVFALATVIVVGIPFAYYVFYRITTIFFAYFTHANIFLPIWLDRILSWVIITPNMHKFHHHFERPWTDSNFGNIFSIWDRIFGTLVYDDPHKVKYGLDVLDDSLDENIGYQLKIPLDKTIKTDY